MTVTLADIILPLWPPDKGPPLPRFIKLYWPWYKAEKAVPVLSASVYPSLIYWEGLTGWMLITDGMVIPYGKSIGVAVTWTNTSSVDMVGHVELSVRNPDGTTLDLIANTNQDKQAAPGNGKSVQFNSFNASQYGSYLLTAKVSSGGRTLNTATTYIVAKETVTEPPPEQQPPAYPEPVQTIVIQSARTQNVDFPEYQSSGFILYVDWYYTGARPGKIDLGIVIPELGIDYSSGVYYGWQAPNNPGQSVSHNGAWFTKGYKPGTYTGRIRLAGFDFSKSHGALYLSNWYNITFTVPIPPPGAVVVINDVTITDLALFPDSIGQVQVKYTVSGFSLASVDIILERTDGYMLAQSGGSGAICVHTVTIDTYGTMDYGGNLCEIKYMSGANGTGPLDFTRKSF